MSVQSPLSWLGAKRRFLDRIFSHFPRHTTFVDVFGGGGSVILGKEPSRVEIYNDLDGRLANFFKVLCDEDKTAELYKKLENTLYSRDVFDEALLKMETELTDVDKAYHFFIINKQSFAGKCKTWGYGVVSSCAPSFSSSINMLKDVHKRIRSGVQVENLSFDDLIPRYDTPDTLFYLDPPYVSTTRSGLGDYECEMTDDMHVNLVNILLSVKGMCILSGYDTNIYKPLEDAGWHRDSFDVSVMSSNGVDGVRPVRTECLWISPRAVENKMQRTLF